MRSSGPATTRSSSTFAASLVIDSAGMAPVNRSAAELLEALGGKLTIVDLDDDLADRFGGPIADAA